MAVTKQTYTATATWTPAQVADLFRQAFIDAELMTDWHDSFLSGAIENRILRVQYDGAKAYGTTFYWFMFDTSSIRIHVATGWNTSTDQPTGTAFLDFFATTTNSVTNHWQMVGASTTQTVRIHRYTSGIDLTQSWFTVDTGAGRKSFTIAPGSTTFQPWINLDRGFYNGFCHVVCLTGSFRAFGVVQFARGPSLRRDIIVGPAFNGNTTSASFRGDIVGSPMMAYGAVGHLSNDPNTNFGFGFSNTPVAGSASERCVGTILLPVGFNSSNPAYPANSSPVFHSMPYSPYIANPLPADMGLTFHYATNVITIGDTFIVSPGTEEWEVLEASPNASAVTGATPVFLARTV
jgi:hypothetical protein